MADHSLHSLLSPASIVVVGASAREDSPGYLLVKNILDNVYSGTLWLVNARHRRILGLKSYRSIRSLPETPDLAIILTPEATLKRMISNCAECGIRNVLIMTITTTRRELRAYASIAGVRLLGPGSAGLIRPALSLNATYSQNRITPGKIAVVSHSAALVSAVVDWAESNDIGFSALVSTGQEIDIVTADIVDYLADDYSTRAIILYVDRVRHSRKFLSAVSAAARNKPVLVLKSGQDGARFCDAVTRTGEVYSSDRVFHTALQRAGVVRIRSFSNLFAAARTLASGARTNGNRLAIISNGAALAMLACDRIQAKGFALPALDADLADNIDSDANSNWSRVNPIVLRNYKQMHQSMADVLKLVLDSNLFDAVMVLYVPDPRCDGLNIASSVAAVANASRKPVLTCWMGEKQVQSSRLLFQEQGILSFRTPEAATDAFDFMYRYHRSQQLLLQLPDPVFTEVATDFEAARKLALDTLAANSRVMPPIRARELLRIANIPVIDSHQASSQREALQKAQEIGYPVAIKLVAEVVRYRSEVDGVRLNLSSDADFCKAFDEIKAELNHRRPDARFEGVLIEPMRVTTDKRALAIRVFRDPTFGPTLSVGIGGDLQSLIYERPVQLPPLNQFLIDHMLSDKHLVKYLGVFRNQQPVNLEALSAILRQVSGMICEIPEIYELDINPLSLDPSGALALDVQIVVQHANNANPGYRHLAIHPYPRDWIREETLNNGEALHVRPIRPEDGERIADMVHNMSPESRYMRFMHAVEDLPPRMIAQFTKIDYDRQMAFCAIPESEPDTIIGVSRYEITADTGTAEFAIAIADDWHGKGVARRLMNALLEHAQTHGLSSMTGDVLRTNHAMRGFMGAMGFTGQINPEEPEQLLFTLQL